MSEALEHTCDVCAPEIASALAKMLVFSSDPTVTLWVCPAHVLECVQHKDMVVGHEDTIEELWEDKEIKRHNGWLK